MASSLAITHFTDPACPWAYSASPDLAVLAWRYGEQLVWRHVMIGLAEDRQADIERGFTPVGMATAYRRFRRYGMPFATAPKPHLSASSPACRVVVATRRIAPEREWEVLRALQFAQFTSPALLDEPDDLRAALARVEGVDAEALVAAIESPEVRDAYEADEPRPEPRRAVPRTSKASRRTPTVSSASPRQPW